MSDYISKSALLDFLEEELKQDRPDDFKIYNTKRYIEDMPTVDEKEIIRKTVERIISRLEQLKCSQEDAKKDYDCAIRNSHFDKSIRICKEEGGLYDSTRSD